VFFQQGVGPCGDPNPPRHAGFIDALGAKSLDKVVASPGVVGKVEMGTELTIAMPSLGVDDEMKLDERSALLVRFTGDMIDPMQFSVLQKKNYVVRVFLRYPWKHRHTLHQRYAHRL
jgi:hypothetical protein